VAGGADPKLTTDENVTALMLAAGLIRWRTAGTTLTEDEETRALEAVKVALELGADVNAADSTTRLTAMHGAAFNGSNRIIQFLVEKGANVDAKDKAGQTPLHIALNIKPPGETIRNLIPVIAWQSTADLLLKLGATPAAPPGAPSSGPAAATAGQ